MIRLFLTITFIGFWCNYSFAATYYVDYNDGNDVNDGLSEITAWKHAPGDPVATDNPSTVGLVAGDVVLFKGGVIYRGSITLKYSGNKNASITYKGNGWGAEKAILDGSEPMTGWRQCTSVEEGGENWQQCYITFVPAGVSAFTTRLAEEDEFLWLAQEPDQPDPFFFDAVDNFVSVPSTHQTTTSLIDTSRFNQSDSDYWDSSYLLLWVLPNVVQMRAILSYNPAEYKVTFDSTNNPDGYNRYSLYNSIHALDQPGEYFFDERSELNGTHRILLWPRNEVDIINEKITLYSKTFGIDIRDNNYITIEGFVVRYYAGSDLTHAVGIGTVSLAYLTKTGITIRNNTITHNVHATGGYGGIYLSHCNDSNIENNEITENMQMKGIFCPDDSAVTVSGNTLRKVGGTCLSFYTGKDCRVFNNTISDGKGTHANGMTFYLDCERILIYNNRVTDFNITLTFQESKDLVFINNIFDGANNTSKVVAAWGGMTGPVTLINNVIVGSDNHYGLYLSSDNPYSTDSGGDSVTFRITNNIIDGGGWESTNSYQYARSNNLYVGLGWNQQWHPWMPSPGEVVDSSGSKYLAILNTNVFVNPSERNYHLKSDSKAINAGVDPESFFPHDIFPDFNWNIDMDGTTRPIGSGWDIGAYEYSGSTGIYEKKNVPTNFMLYQNYPNPFNPTTKIQFSLPSRSFVSLKIFDILGKEVSTIVSKELSAGIHLRQWNAKDSPNGVYFYRLQAGNFIEVKKLVLLK